MKTVSTVIAMFFIFTSFIFADSGADKVYTKEIHKNLGQYAAWPSGYTYQPGDYGYMIGKRFNKIGNIRDAFKIKLVLKTTQDSGVRQWQSAKGVKFSFSGSTRIKEQGGGKATVKFQKKNVVVFKSQGLRTVYLKNYKQVGDKLIALHKKKGNSWKLKYHVITEVTQAREVLVIVAQKKNTKVTISGNAKNVKGVADINLTSSTQVNGKGVLVEHRRAKRDRKSKKMVFPTPLFKLSKVKSPAFKKAFFQVEK